MVDQDYKQSLASQAWHYVHKCRRLSEMEKTKMIHDEEMAYALSNVMQPELDYLVERYVEYCDWEHEDSLKGFIKWIDNMKQP